MKIYNKLLYYYEKYIEEIHKYLKQKKIINYDKISDSIYNAYFYGFSQEQYINFNVELIYNLQCPICNVVHKNDKNLIIVSNLIDTLMVCNKNIK